jgi:hypothetical protein
VALARKRVESIKDAQERKKIRDRLNGMIDRCRFLSSEYNDMKDANMSQLMRLERQRLERILEFTANGDRDG